MVTSSQWVRVNSLAIMPANWMIASLGSHLLSDSGKKFNSQENFQFGQTAIYEQYCFDTIKENWVEIETPVLTHSQNSMGQFVNTSHVGYSKLVTKIGSLFGFFIHSLTRSSFRSLHRSYITYQHISTSCPLWKQTGTNVFGNLYEDVKVPWKFKWTET